MKRQKLKNENIFVSTTRLCVHNIPVRVDDKQLKTIFLKAAEDRKAHITEVSDVYISSILCRNTAIRYVKGINNYTCSRKYITQLHNLLLFHLASLVLYRLTCSAWLHLFHMTAFVLHGFTCST